MLIQIRPIAVAVVIIAVLVRNASQAHAVR